MESFLENEEDIRNFVTGCAFYSTGGGGEPAEGERILLERLQARKTFNIKALRELKNEEWIACAYYVGSIAPINREQEEKLKSLGLGKIKFEAFRIAIEELEKELGIRVAAMIATELGGLNSATSVALAAEIGIPTIDGDLAGRAIPESTQSLVSIYGMPIRPHVFCDSGGNTTMIKQAKSWANVERIGKMISVAGGGLTPTIGKLLRGDEVKSIAIEGTMRRCYQSGRDIRKSKDPAELCRVVRDLNGRTLFHGEVCEKKWEDREGYLFGEVVLEGLGNFLGHRFKIWFKNENHLSWMDDRVFVTSPDLIVQVKEDRCAPITNSKIENGDRVWVFGFPCDRRYRTAKAVELLGPAHFGFQYPYIPIEEITRG